MLDHPFIKTLRNMRGNVRACVYTEPLWGIPFNLYAPYVSVYMLALGLTDSQIGLVTTIGMVCSVFWTLLSGAITDKLGRKRTTLIFDIISWSVPCLIWAVAQDFCLLLSSRPSSTACGASRTTPGSACWSKTPIPGCWWTCIPGSTSAAWSPLSFPHWPGC